MNSVKGLNRRTTLIVSILVTLLFSDKGLSQTGTDLYATLGVPPQATEQEIKLGYRRMAAKFHPDKWVHTSETEVRQAQEQFVRVRDAYEVLSDIQKRTQYDASRGVSSPQWNSQDFTQALKDLENSRTKQDVLQNLDHLNKFMDYIYHGSGANDPSKPAQELHATFEKMIAAGRFGDVETLRAFIQMTASWTYYEAENHYTKTLNWDGLHTVLLRGMILQGTPLNQVFEVLNTINMQVEIKLAMPFMNHNSMKSRPSPYYLTTEVAEGMLQALLEKGQIRTAAELFETLEVLRRAAGSNLHMEEVFSREALVGYTKKVTPWLSQMTGQQIFTLSRMILYSPLETLGFAQALIDNQKQQSTLNAEDLSRTLKRLFEGSLDHYLKEAKSFTRGPLIDSYMRAHTGYTEHTLQSWVDAEREQTLKSGALFAPDRGHERFLYKVLQKDFQDLLVMNKAALDKAGLNATQWQTLKKALNIGGVSFATSVALSSFSFQKKINWGQELQKSQVKTAAITAPKCSSILLSK